MPELSLRADLARLRPTSVGANAGLWLDRFLPEQLTAGEHPPPRDEHPYTKHIKAAAGIGEPAIYKRFFTHWQTALDNLPQYERVKTG